MALFKITRLGLGSIGVLVLVLWGCLLSERALLRQSRMDHYRALRDLRYLKLRRVMEPASHPAPAPPPSTAREVIG
ncbi:MAG: hypothetical protein HYR60_28220 [Acidobacteria bacterium]|nr:hypothetical protein [Acidobacteriota bacterium]MBI3470704.1 hypothetical protein [Candidatus Solibacter usitatus]